MWNGTMFVDLDWPLNASSLLSASAELLVRPTYYFQHTTNNCQADNMAVIHVTKINYITSGHLETHLFTRNKHTCTKHPATANMRFHCIFYAL